MSRKKSMSSSSFLLIIAFFASVVHGKKLMDVYWNSTDNHDMEMCAVIGDTVDIFCPFYPADTKEGLVETSIIYRVSKDDFNECHVGDKAREVGRCNQPHDRSNLNVAFRRFHPVPFALEYKPDTTYYFISTSTGRPDGLEERRGGLCTTRALKMRIHVMSKEGACPHKHRHHHVHHGGNSDGGADSSASASSSSQWPAAVTPRPHIFPALPEVQKPLWKDFYDKIWTQSGSQWQAAAVASNGRHGAAPSRAERIALDAEPSAYKMADTYEAAGLQSDGEIEFQIHEIGEEPDSQAYSASAAPTSKRRSSTVLIALLLAVFYRLHLDG